jgi:hypothetical protein
MSERLKVKTESLPARCDICHQSDRYDAIANHCARCVEMAPPAPSTPTTKSVVRAYPNAPIKVCLYPGIIVGIIYFTVTTLLDLSRYKWKWDDKNLFINTFMGMFLWIIMFAMYSIITSAIIDIIRFFLARAGRAVKYRKNSDNRYSGRIILRRLVLGALAGQWPVLIYTMMVIFFSRNIFHWIVSFLKDLCYFSAFFAPLGALMAFLVFRHADRENEKLNQ